MAAPVLIFGIGNESRGDDALGPLLLRDLDAWLAAQGLAEQFELLEEFQLQIEHTMDMKDRRVVLFIDAGMDSPENMDTQASPKCSDPAAFTFYRAKKDQAPVLYSHALAPEALLKVYQQFYHEAPPDVFILCIRGEQFELGEPLSLQATANLAAALKFSRNLLLEPSIANWDRYCTSQTAPIRSAQDESAC